VVMTQQAAVAPVAVTPVVIATKQKSVAAAMLLALLFGPLGLLYVSVRGAIITLLISIVLTIATAGAILPLVWGFCIVCAAIAAKNPS
jgi:hypothetical protein